MKIAARLEALSPDKRAAVEKLWKERGVEIARPSLVTRREPPLVAVARDGGLPLTYAQQRVWFLHQLDPRSSSFHLQLRIVLPGTVELVEHVVGALIARHEIFRTTYRMSAHEPVQIIHAPRRITLPVVDLGGLGVEAVATEGSRLLREQREVPFDLEAGPVWRACALKLSGGHSGLIMTVHHIATDGWSLNGLMQEAHELGRAYSLGVTPNVPPLPVQYADYAAWQRAWLRDEVLEEKLGYWRERLAGMPPALELLTDFPRPAAQTYNGAAIWLPVPDGLAGGLKELARARRVTLFTLLLAIFKILLARYTGQDDIVVGTPVARRTPAEVEHVQGLFLNSLVLRTGLSGDPTFSEALSRVGDSVLGALAHQDMPFEKLVQDLQPRRDLSRNPLFQALFNKPILPAFTKEELPDGPSALEEGQSEFDVALWVEEHRDLIGLSFNFNTDLFRRSTIERMAGHYLRLAEAVVADPEQRIGALPLLGDAERNQLLHEWNRTDQALPLDPVPRLFERRVAEAPDAIALEYDTERLNYRELNARANRLARFLRRAGVGPGVKVGIFLERGPDMVAGVLAVLKAGGAYVPLDPAYPPERLAFMVEDSETALLLARERLLSGRDLGRVRVVCLDRDRHAIDTESSDDLDEAPDKASLAYMIYTSGSTGRPKGVQIQHGALSNLLQSMAREPGLDARDVLVAVTTLSFDIAGLELYLPLIAGARLVLAGRDTAADGAALATLLQASGATVMQATPATWRLLLAAGWQGSPKLKILCGGEPLPRELSEALRTRCGALWNMYGPTETTIWSTVHQVGADATGPVPIGRPIANTRIYLLDGRMQPVPIGVPGELYIGGAGLALGYWRRPELNAERFVADPFGCEPGARLYRTGDRARYLPDGNIEYLGRLDNQVKLRGFRIELGEVESALERIACVRQAAVQVREDRPGDQRLAAYVVCDDAAVRNPEHLRSILARSLPSYMVPSEFVFLDGLPLTPNGKVDLKALPVVGAKARSGEDFVAPATQLEHALMAVWREVLGLGRISVDDNFFDIGGHSLLAIEVIVKFKEQTGRALDPRNFYQQTLGQLAASVDDSPVEPRAPLTPAAFELEPVFLGTEARRLFGLFRLAQNPRGMGIVLCQPHAHEYIRCHRAFRELGQRLARSGFHVLSFDYYGTGDSAGDYDEGTISGWVEDTTRAIRAMREKPGVERICLVGLRLGATLALAAGAACAGIDGFVLWDPIVAGADVASEVERIRELQSLDPAAQRDIQDPDVLSFRMTPGMARELQQIDLCAVQPPAGAALLVLETECEGSGRRLAARVKNSGSRVDYLCINDGRIWLREPYEAIVPQNSMREIVSFVSDLFP